MVACPDHPVKKFTKFTSGLSGQEAGTIRSNVLTTCPTEQAPLSSTLRSSFSVLRLLSPPPHSTRVQLSRERYLCYRTDLQTLQSPYRLSTRFGEIPLNHSTMEGRKTARTLRRHRFGKKIFFHSVDPPHTNLIQMIVVQVVENAFREEKNGYVFSL